MSDEEDLRGIIDGLGHPLHQAQGAVNTLFGLCNSVGKEQAQILSFIANGLEVHVRNLHARYGAAHNAVSNLAREQPGPRVVK